MRTKLLKITILIGCAIFPIATNAQTINLQLQGDYAIGNSVTSPSYAVGDVNNDGLPDLVTLNKNNASAQGPISVFLNNGAGGFAAPINITDTTNLSPNAAAIGDYNRDGNPDLAIAADGLSTGINIRLGNGTGNFPTGTYIAERGSPAIASADFNGDGNLDLAICNNVNELRVLNGNGAGAFGAAASFTTAAVCQDLITADFNVDGRPDLAVAMRLAPSDRGVQVFLNSGTSFNAPLNIAGAAAAQKLAVADFNRDCIPDLAAGQFESSVTGTPIFILLGNGAGGFTSAPTLNVNNFPHSMAIGDFNRDKKVDLAIRRNINNTPGANNLTIFPGNGAGGFGAPFEASIAVATSSTDMQIATIDANRDGRDDLIIGRQGGFLLYNNNSPLFTRTENDFDGDLKTDLSVYRPSTGVWYARRSTQGFLAARWGISTDKLAPADYDGDGKTDIAVWRESEGNFYILNSSTNTFNIQTFGVAGDALTVGDWDGDGKADVSVYRDSASGSQSYFFYRGSLNNPNNNTTFVPWGTTGDKAVTGDFDGDGKIDAAVFRPSNAVWYVLQSSNGQFLYRSWGLAADIRVPADYDGDGKTDFAVFRSSDNVWYILNSATATATYRTWGTSGDLLTPADYNGDGKTEVAVYRPSDQSWYIPRCGDFNQYGARFGASGDVAVPAKP